MNLINLLCFTFLTSDKTTSSSEPAVTSSGPFFSNNASSTLPHDTPSISETESTTEALDFEVLPHDTPSTSETESTTEALDFEVLPHDTPSTIETESTTEALDIEVVTVSKEENNNKIPRGNFQDGGKTPKRLSPDNGNESALSKGKVAVALVFSCIIAVALIWICKIIYTLCHSKSYDLRQDVNMGNL